MNQKQKQASTKQFLQTNDLEKRQPIEDFHHPSHHHLVTLKTVNINQSPPSHNNSLSTTNLFLIFAPLNTRPSTIKHQQKERKLQNSTMNAFTLPSTVLFIISTVLLCSLSNLNGVQSFSLLSVPSRSSSSSSSVGPSFQHLTADTNTFSSISSSSSSGSGRSTDAVVSSCSGTALYGKKAARAAGNESSKKKERVKKTKDDVLEIEAVVLESLPNAMFRCQLDGAPDTQEPVLATISGKIRKNFVKILVGDKVLIELSPYDLTRGRITFRYR